MHIVINFKEEIPNTNQIEMKKNCEHKERSEMCSQMCEAHLQMKIDVQYMIQVVNAALCLFLINLIFS
jgi:hypothetical protein